ncbi:hypothetical protein HO133_004721 [Letharia lupina]|uniref:Aminoglycoside phosphotransferase domain-containing protein n=1 Tax=Letharia lupina TaxID=560253 RepID=A0A8H6FKT9_9LECA|nr:uncharacterized protein HO133_004721 [Letharia lupina]KAF6230379.1 hypothetical protein HO133_004721 [Letharia lupina]
MICSSHFCAEHSRLPFHYPSQDTESDAYWTAYHSANTKHLLNRLYQVKTTALVSLASRLRNGISCTIPALMPDGQGHLDVDAVSRQMGGQNCNIDVQFEDGVVWLARIRLDDPLLPPKPTQAYIFLSEVFTLKYLEDTGIPAPKVFHFATESSENPVGVPFMLIEKMKGAPLMWDTTTPIQRTKVLEQLADILLALEKHSFHSTGSLFPSNGSGNVCGFAQSQLFDSPNTTLGPFDTLESSLRAMLAHQRRLIANGELSSLAIDHYLSHRWREDMVPEVLSLHNDAGFFLKHFDDKGDHILVDDDFNITGIIDWEFASLEPKAQAFSSPCMLWPVGDFHAGSNRLSPEEMEFAAIFERRGRNDMAHLVRNGRKMQRYLFFNGGSVSHEQEDFEAMFQGLRAAWAGDNSQPGPYQVWKEEALKKYEGDEQLGRLLQRNSTRSQSATHLDCGPSTPQRHHSLKDESSEILDTGMREGPAGFCMRVAARLSKNKDIAY